jgi:antitoxin CptB
MVASHGDDAPLDERALSKLRWRCRRGMLENDLFLERFFLRHGQTLTERNGDALMDLMDLSDNDLLDLHLGRRTPAEIDARLDRSDVVEVLAMVRASN